jgi:hypothetical protein
MRLHPLREHRWFCPWIVDSRPGWEQALALLLDLLLPATTTTTTTSSAAPSPSSSQEPFRMAHDALVKLHSIFD